MHRPGRNIEQLLLASGRAPVPKPGFAQLTFRPRAAAGLLATAAALLLAACSREPPPGWAGYAEGEYVYVAAPIAGTLARLYVQSGQQVTRGKPLFELDADAERAARAEAQARLAAARFQAANADKGKRPPEIAMQQ